jgi:hypothetical protein
VTFSAPGTATIDGDTITIGTSTRREVDAALGTGVVDGDNAFRVYHCQSGVLVQYVDADGTLSTEPAASSSDVVARIVTVTGANAAAGTARLGELAPTVEGATVADVGDGEIRFSRVAGRSFLVDAAGVLTQIAAFKPQTGDLGNPGIWTLPIGLANDAQDLNNLGRGATFADFDALLGSDWDTTGEIGLVLATVQVRIWASAGIRIAGVCEGGFAAVCDETTPVSNVTLTPPFFGRDGALGIGATRAEIEAETGTGTVDGGVVVYGDPSPSGDALGVVYVQDSACVDRAAAFVFNYFNPN